MLTMVTALQPTSERDILSQDFFQPGYFIIYANGSNKWVPGGLITTQDAIAEIGPDFIAGVYSLGKSFYSTILSDLGQSVESNPFTQLPVLMKFMNETNAVSVDGFVALKTFD